jgi:hypothetical protein
MTKQQQQDILSDIMIELNLVGDIAFNRDDKKTLQLLDTVNNRLVYLWGSLE